MALIQANFMSGALMRTVPVNIILPVDKLAFPGAVSREITAYKTLYLLHGIFGNYTDWVSGTNIQRWAEERDLAVVMPSGDNMFYVDQKESLNYYGEFIGREPCGTDKKGFPAIPQEGGYIYSRAVNGRLWGNTQWIEVS